MLFRSDQAMIHSNIPGMSKDWGNGAGLTQVAPLTQSSMIGGWHNYGILWKPNSITFILDGVPAALPHIRSGKMKPLAVTGLKRHPLLPDVPTFNELGYKGFDGVQWYGIVGPANLPAACPGRDHLILEKDGCRLLVFTVLGRSYLTMKSECPFR